MARGYSDPWKRKSAKGMRRLTKMTNTAIKVGTIAYRESLKNKPKSRQQYVDYNSSIDNVPMTGAGCAIVLLGGVIFLAILFLTNASFIGFIIGGVVMVISVAIATLVAKDSASKDSSIDVPNDVAVNIVPQEVISIYAVLINQISEAILVGNSYEGFTEELSTLPSDVKKNVLVMSFEKAIKKLQDEGKVNVNIQDSVDRFAEFFKLSQNDIGQSPMFEVLIKMLVLNDLLLGIHPTRMSLTASIPVVLQKDEKLIWFFSNVGCYEPREKKIFVGASQGLSIKIANGVYYKVGAFKGEPIITSEMKMVSYGQVYVTNKNIFFHSLEKSIKVPYSKVVAYTPFEDAIGIQRDGSSLKPIYLKGVDGWFIFNIVKNISNLEERGGSFVSEPPKEEREINVTSHVGEEKKEVVKSSTPSFCDVGNLVYEKKYHEAIELGEKLLKENPTSCGVHVNLMDAYFKVRDENPLYYEKSTFHAKMAMRLGHNTGYVQNRLVVNLEKLGYIHNAVQVCNIILSDEFHFSRTGSGRKEDFKSRLEKLEKKLHKSKELDSSLCFTKEDIQTMLDAIKAEEENERRERERFEKMKQEYERHYAKV